MTQAVVMCADEESQCHSELLGLAGENLAAQEWLTMFSSGERARTHLRGQAPACEAWVVSSADVDPINLAAAIKRDCRERCVRLVSFEANGSLKSRARSAGIDSVLDRSEFAARYAQAKKESGGATGAGSNSFGEDALGKCASGNPKDLRVAIPSREAILTAHATVASSPSDLAGAVCATTEGGLRAVQKEEFRKAPLWRSCATKRGAFVLPVLSGSGGAGKSTVAVLAATIASRMGYKTLLADFDLQFGDMKPLLGRDDAVAIDEIADDSRTYARLLSPTEGPVLLAAPSRIERCEDIARRSPEIIGVLRDSFDVIVANTGGFWMEQHMALLECADKALLLIDQRPSSLRACSHVLELCSRCAVATSPIVFAVNRCARGSLYTSIDASCALRGAHVAELAEGGPDVEEALAMGRPEDLLEAGNALCASVERVLFDLLPELDGGPRRHAVAAPRRLFSRRRIRGRAACL